MAILDDDNDEVAFVATGTGTLDRAVKCDAVKDAYVAAYPGATAANTEVKWEEKRNGTYAYNVYVNKEFASAYTEGDVTAVPGAPTPVKQWELIDDDDDLDDATSPNGQTYKEVFKELANSKFISKPTFTPVSATNIKVTNINWRPVSDKVPCYGADQNPAQSIEEFYCGEDGKLEGCTKYAIIPILKTDGDLAYKLIGKKDDGTVVAYSESWTVDGVTFDCGQTPTP